MITKCAICAEYMPTYQAYTIHKELLHTVDVVKPKQGKFLTKNEKQMIVHKGELRLGKEHFYDGR